MPAQFTKHFVQDLTQDIKIRQCGTIAFNADNESNVISVDLYNGTEEYSGGGSVAGACICPDGSTVALTGSISGKTASVILTGDCFAFPGQIGIGVQVVSGTVKTTVLKAIYNVELFETDDMVDPGSRITASVGQLVADIEAATAEIPASDMASLMSGIAPTFSTSTNYAAGAYVYYSGTLYRFTADHAAGSWTGTDATQVALGNDLGNQVSDLKSALSNLNDLDYVTEREYVDDLAYGRIASNGTIGTEQYIAYSPVMRVTGDTWYFDTANFRLFIAYYAAETDTVPASFSSWITESPYTVPDARPYYKLMVSRLTSSGQLDINAAQGSVYKLNELPSALIDAAKLADARLTTVYVSATNGNDSNEGTASSPLATIQAAVDSGASEILVEEGEYPRFVIDGAKYPISIGIWNFNGTTHKIKITDSGVGTNTMIRINNCLDITISDMWADNAQRALFYITNVQRATLIRCIASNNTTATFHGFAFVDTNAFLYDCIAHDIAQDGFNFHNTGSSLMENCTAYNCADDGVSHHDQCTGSIIGGEFYNCGKGGVASPTYGAHIDIHNVYSHDNEYGLFAEGQSNKLINCRVSGCAFKNNTLYDLYANYGTVVGWNNIYDTLSNPNDAYTEIVKSD